MKTRRKRHLLIGMTLLGIVLLSFLFLFPKNKTNASCFEIDSRIEKVKTTTVLNNKALGWVRVSGTNIDIPIINKLSDEEDDATLNYAWYSTNYIEGENRKVIYGHNIQNVSRDPLIAYPSHFKFEQLMSFTDYNFASRNLYIQVTENNEDKLYKIYAVSFRSIFSDFGGSLSEEVDTYIENAKRISIYDYDVDIDREDELISLITCTRFYGNGDKTQFVVDARRVRENEKNCKYFVETNTNYDIMKEE